VEDVAPPGSQRYALQFPETDSVVLCPGQTGFAVERIGTKGEPSETSITKSRSAPGPPESCALTRKANDPSPIGDPEISPVEESRKRPGGREPDTIVQATVPEALPDTRSSAYWREQ